MFCYTIRAPRVNLPNPLLNKIQTTSDLVNEGRKSIIFSDIFIGSSPTSTTSHLPIGVRAPRFVSLRQSCSWAIRRLVCCRGSSLTVTSVLVDLIQPWQLVIAVKMAKALLLGGLIKTLDFTMSFRVCSSAVDT